MEYALVIASVVAAGAAAYGAYQEGQAKQQAGRAEAQNAEMEASNRQQEGAEARERERTGNFRRMGTLRARLAQSGSLSETGTPLSVLGEHSANLELRIQDAARSSSIQAAGLRHQAAMARWEGDQAAKAGTIKAVATFASGLAQSGSSYTQGVNQGLQPDTFNLYRTRTIE